MQEFYKPTSSTVARIFLHFCHGKNEMNYANTDNICMYMIKKKNLDKFSDECCHIFSSFCYVMICSYVYNNTYIGEVGINFSIFFQIQTSMTPTKRKKI